MRVGASGVEISMVLSPTSTQLGACGDVPCLQQPAKLVQGLPSADETESSEGRTELGLSTKCEDGSCRSDNGLSSGPANDLIFNDSSTVACSRHGLALWLSAVSSAAGNGGVALSISESHEANSVE